MPGAITHLYAAHRFLRSGQKMVANKFFGEFMFGTIYPDCGYWPGKNSELSDLVHYVGTSQFPKLIYDNTESAGWKAFALGWLLHVYLDINGHPFVNKLAAAYVGSNKKEISYEEDKALHAKMETGLDVALSMRFGKVDSTSIRLPDFSENPLSNAFLLNYALVVSSYKIKKNGKNIPKSIARLNIFQNYLYRNKKITGLLLKLIKLVYRSNYELVEAIINPAVPEPEILDRYLNIVDHVLNIWQKENQPDWLVENYNLDTGKISHKGDYKLADRAFQKVSSKMIRQNIYEEYPETAKKIIKNWDKIKIEFIKEDSSIK